MVEWRTEPLIDCLETLIDYRGKSPPKSDAGIPVLSAKVVKTTGLLQPIEQMIAADYYPKWMTRGVPHPGDVVMTTEAPMGEVIQLDEETAGFALGQRIVCMRGKGKKLDNTFLRYRLVSPIQQQVLASYATGTTVLGISQKALRSMPISFPSHTEQKSIGQILAALDDMIELNRRMNEALESMAREIFKDWFVNFGPTLAKAEDRAPYLAPGLWDLFPDTLDDTNKPEGWSLSPLTTLAEVNPESWSARNTPEEIEYVDLANTKWGTIETTQRFRWPDAPSRARRILRPGDTIVGTVRPGNGSFAFIGGSGLTGSTGFAVLRPQRVEYREVVYLSATAPKNLERLANLADGAAYPAVRPDIVGATNIVLCEDRVLTKFSELLYPAFRRIEANKRESQTLAETRDFLLPKLMSGEIRLKEAEKAVEAVA